MLDPVSSTPRVAGTHEGVVSMVLSGVRPASSHIARTPASPRTLATSWGSAYTPTVPCGTTPRANSDGPTIEDSICMWVSIRPGAA